MRNYLIQMRKDRGWTQTTAAEKCGMPQSSYSAIESCSRQKDISLSTLQKLSKGFGVPVSVLIDCEAQRQNSA